MIHTYPILTSYSILVASCLSSHHGLPAEFVQRHDASPKLKLMDSLSNKCLEARDNDPPRTSSERHQRRHGGFVCHLEQNPLAGFSFGVTGLARATLENSVENQFRHRIDYNVSRDCANGHCRKMCWSQSLDLCFARNDPNVVVLWKACRERCELEAFLPKR